MAQHTIIVDGRSYDLPKKDLNVAKKIDEVLKVDSTKGYSIEQKFNKLHTFAKEILGNETAEEILGSSKLAEIDLSDLTLVARMIIDGYEKPIDDYQAERARERIGNIPLSEITAMTKAAQTVANTQLMKS
jgi:hypothetical protein